ncbi:hypothetical protein HDU67_006413 [Dinochytrium kinnereticum]|nr:hypothetical protein HDU67_006413 [Dinochytrium kinnereticum]
MSPTLTARSSVVGSPLSIARKGICEGGNGAAQGNPAMDYINWLTEYLGETSDDLAEGFGHVALAVEPSDPSDFVPLPPSGSGVSGYGAVQQYGALSLRLPEPDFLVEFKRMAWHSHEIEFIFTRHPDLRLEFLQMIESQSAIIRHAARRNRTTSPSPSHWSTASSYDWKPQTWQMNQNMAQPPWSVEATSESQSLLYDARTVTVPVVNVSVREAGMGERGGAVVEKMSKSTVFGVVLTVVGVIGVAGWFLYSCIVYGVCQGFL